MPKNNDSEVRRIADQIESYLQSHPHAADTIVGIDEWWIPAQGIDASRAMIQQALDDLCLRSLLEWKAHPSGKKIYSRHQPKAE